MAKSTTLFTVSAPSDHPRPTFSLLRWFAALSLICIVLISAATAVFLSRFIERHMLLRDATVSMEFINSIVRTERTWWYFMKSEKRPDSTPPDEPVESFFNHVSQLPDVVRANVYGSDGKILWSSTASLIGQRFDRNDELDRAFRGDVAVHSGAAGDYKPEHVAFEGRALGTRFVEAYLPIWDPTRESVVGVVEIYKLPHALFESIDEGIYLVWGSAAVGAAFLWVCLFWIVRRADRLIRVQHEQLVASETFATIGEMASAVAHGIRNPLASIRSAAEVARGEEPAIAQDCLADIEREADRLSNWVRDLLIHTRGEQAPIEPVDLDALVRKCADGFAAAATRQRVHVRIEGSSAPPVRGNLGPLGHALNSVIANAIEAMPNGGLLSIKSRHLPHKRTVELDIADTGLGLAPHVAKRIFRPFITTKPNGVGLGLSLVRRIVSRYSGEVRIVSGEGRGTTVTIALPVAG